MTKRIIRFIGALITCLTLINLIQVPAQAYAEDTITVGKTSITEITTVNHNPKIHWDFIAYATGYRVYRKTDTDKKYVKVIDTNQTSYIDTNWKANKDTAISYKIRPYVVIRGKTIWGDYSTAKKWKVNSSKHTATASPTERAYTDSEPKVAAVNIEKRSAQTATKLLYSEIGINENDSRYLKVKKVHDWMVANISYSYYFKEYEKMVDADWDTNDANQYYKWADITLQKRISICSGYAATYKLFLSLLDIPCLYISGPAPVGSYFIAQELYDNPGHAWNMVYMDDGHWYHVDVTWDDSFWDNYSELIEREYPDGNVCIKCLNIWVRGGYSTAYFLRNEQGMVREYDGKGSTVPLADGGYYERNFDHTIRVGAGVFGSFVAQDQQDPLTIRTEQTFFENGSSLIITYVNGTVIHSSDYDSSGKLISSVQYNSNREKELTLELDESGRIHVYDYRLSGKRSEGCIYSYRSDDTLLSIEYPDISTVRYYPSIDTGKEGSVSSITYYDENQNISSVTYYYMDHYRVVFYDSNRGLTRQYCDYSNDGIPQILVRYNESLSSGYTIEHYTSDGIIEYSESFNSEGIRTALKHYNSDTTLKDYTYYNTNGQITEFAEYGDDGVYTSTSYNNGKITSIRTVDLDGIQTTKSFDKNGKLSSESRITSGYHPSGALIIYRSEYYDNIGTLLSVYQIYDKKGNVITNNCPEEYDALELYYDKSGQVSCKEYYTSSKSGSPQHLKTEQYENGKLTFTELYDENGNRVTSSSSEATIMSKRKSGATGSLDAQKEVDLTNGWERAYLYNGSSFGKGYEYSASSKDLYHYNAFNEGKPVSSTSTYPSSNTTSVSYYDANGNLSYSINYYPDGDCTISIIYGSSWNDSPHTVFLFADGGRQETELLPDGTKRVTVSTNGTAELIYDQSGKLIKNTRLNAQDLIIGRTAILSILTNKDWNPVITWMPFPKASGYYLYRKTTSDSDYVKIADISTTTYTDSKWEAADWSFISYKVKAYVIKDDGTTIWSDMSEEMQWIAVK